MKLLRALTMGRHATSRWALFGSAVLWVGVMLSTPTPATATNYEMDKGSGSGLFGPFSGGTIFSTFTLDVSASAPFTAWHVIDAISIYSDSGRPFVSNEEVVSGDFRLQQFIDTADRRLALIVTPSTLSWVAVDLQLLCNECGITDKGSIRVVGGQNIPEPATAVLLATGLLVLAGSRWLPRRGARQQLG